MSPASSHATVTTNTAHSASVERVIASPPGPIFDLLADPSRHCDIDGSGTVRDSTDAAQRVELGSTFGMNMKWGINYAMVNTIIEFEEDRRIAWQAEGTVAALGKVIGGRIWRYELEPNDDGSTLVRETWDITHERLPALVRPLRSKTIANMTATLDRIEQLVTAG